MDNIPANERDLVRLVQNGNFKAKLQLVEKFRGFICTLVNQHSNGSTKFDDLEQEAICALLECIPQFDLSRNNGFRAFAEWRMRKRLRLHAKLCALGGAKSEANIDRWFHSNVGRLAKELGPQASATALAKAIVEACGCPLGQAFDAVGRHSFAASHVSYYIGASDQENEAVGYERSEAVVCESHDMRRSYGCFDARQLTPHIGLHRAISRYIDDIADERRARERLKEIGRRQYALELVERGALVPPAPPKLKARPRRKRKRKAHRRPQIRSWRSWQTTQENQIHV